MPRWIDAKRVTFKYGLGEEFIGVLQTLHLLGLDSTTPLRVRSANGPVEVAPRDVVAAALPDPATIGPQHDGQDLRRPVGDRAPAPTGARARSYLYHVSDNEWTMREYESQCVVWQTALNPVIALELLATGVWTGVGVLGPEAFDAEPFLDAHGAAAERRRLRPGVGPRGEDPPHDERADGCPPNAPLATAVGGRHAACATRRPRRVTRTSRLVSACSRAPGATAAAPTAPCCRRWTTRATPCSSPPSRSRPRSTARRRRRSASSAGRAACTCTRT